MFLSGILFLIVSLTPLREWIIGGIPRSQKMAIAAGIGLFLGLLALKNAGLVAANRDTLITLGDPRAPSVVLAAIGFVAMVALDARRVPGAILIAVLGVTAVGIALGISPFAGIVATPPSLTPTLLAMDVGGNFRLGAVSVILAFFFVDLFDSTGTLVGVANQAGLLRPDGTLPRLRKVLLADSLSVMAGAALGTSPVTSFIESAAGVEAGGRTGLTAITTGLLFLATALVAPWAQLVPAAATAPALVLVGAMMLAPLAEVAWTDPLEALPAFLTVALIPFTFSIATGLAFGIAAHALLKLARGRLDRGDGLLLALAVLIVWQLARGAA